MSPLAPQSHFVSAGFVPFLLSIHDLIRSFSQFGAFEYEPNCVVVFKFYFVFKILFGASLNKKFYKISFTLRITVLYNSMSLNIFSGDNDFI